MEIWKDVLGYDGFYQVSNFGNVRSVDRKDRSNRFKKGIVLKQKTEYNKYKRVHLSKDNTTKYFSVHRLVAQAFVAQKEGLNIVNHLDNNPSNNYFENLEWTSYKGNMQYASKQGRMHYKPENLKKAIESKKKPVIGTNGAEVIRFSCAAEASNYGFNSRHISNCCNKKYGYKTHKKYEWRFENE